MADYTTNLDSIQNAITHATRSKRHVNTIMINQYYYHADVSKAASEASDALTILLSKLKAVEASLIPPAKVGPMADWAFLSDEERAAEIADTK